MTAWYNEIDNFAADWLLNLIDEGLIPPGVVDRRDIRDVEPADLVGFTQCHFFAGIGGWPYAARLAGWPDDRQIWTGSCPCQPFSVAGAGGGTGDDRHLWPYLGRLIATGRPAVVVGEQTASPAGYAWFDGVACDLESEGYTWRASDLAALAVGAPHIRQRLYWIAVSNAYRLPPIRFAKPRQEPLPWPSEPTISRVAHGLPSRLVRGCVAGFGNAVVAPLAAEVLSAFLDAESYSAAMVDSELIG